MSRFAAAYRTGRSTNRTGAQGWLRIILIGGGIAVGLAGVFAWSGLTARDSVALALVLASNVASGGSLLATWLRRQLSAAEVIGGGVAVAAVWVMSLGLIMPSGVVMWLSLPVLALAAAVTSAVRPRVLRPPRIVWRPATLAAGATATLVALALNRYQWERYRLSGTIDYSTFHPDNIFLQAVGTASSAAGAGVGGLSDWPLRYHWLSYSMSGGLESLTDAMAFSGMTRALPVVVILGLAFLASGWAGRAASPTWVAFLAPLMVVAGRFVGDPIGVPVNWDSLSQTVSGPILVAACYLAVYLPARRTHWIAAVFFAVSFVLAGTKLSAAVILVCGVVALAIVGYVTKASRRHATAVVAAVCVAGVSAAFLLLESGQSGGGGLALRELSALPSLGAPLATTLAVLPGWAGLIYLAARPIRRWSPVAALGVGLAVGGLGPLWLLAEARPNSTWFLVSATTCVWLLSALGAGRAVQSLAAGRAAQWWVAAAAAASAAAAAVLWAMVLRTSAAVAVTVLAQIAFVLLLVVVCSAAAWVLQRRGIRGVIVPLLVAAATMSTVTVVAADRVGGTIVTATTSSASDAPATEAPAAYPARKPLAPTELDALSRQLDSVAHHGDVVAFDDDRVAPALLRGRLVPYAAYKRYSTALSVEGSRNEFDSRRRTVGLALAGDSTAAEALCGDGVRWLVGAAESGTADPGTAGLPGMLSVEAVEGGYQVIRLRCGSP